MKRAGSAGTVAVLILLMGMQTTASAQVVTVWNKLGIPQGWQKFRDARVNSKGKHPQWEAKPKLLALADPANLASEVPAIKIAAEVKADQDLKDQKIKAVKYLASIGCGCYPQVKEALLASLDDCTEDVRYEAALAFCMASGNPCSFCNQNSCCDEEVMEKLKNIAEGMDDNDCYYEPSWRVRAAAGNALNACRAVIPPEDEIEREVPTEAVPTEAASREVAPVKRVSAEAPGVVRIEG